VQPLHGYDTQPFQLVTGPPRLAAGDRKIPVPEWLGDGLTIFAGFSQRVTRIWPIYRAVRDRKRRKQVMKISDLS